MSVNGGQSYLDISPCNLACPAGINVQKYISEIKKGKFYDAWKTITQDNPFAALSGYLCLRPCEYNCRYEQMEYRKKSNFCSVPIRELKKFVSNWVWEEKGFDYNYNPVTKKEKIAVIGSGIAALTSAWQLRKIGFSVTIFDTDKTLGGIWKKIIPDFIMPQDILNDEINAIINFEGITYINYIKLDREYIQSLWKNGFAALILATDADYFDYPDYIKKLDNKIDDFQINIMDIYNNLSKIDFPSNIIICGGDYLTITTARLIKRNHPDVEPTVIYPWPLELWPADNEHIESAIKEGVKLLPQKMVKNIKVEDNQLIIEIVKADFDQNNRKIILTSEKETIKTQKAVLKTNRINSLKHISESIGIDINVDGTIKIDPEIFSTSKAGIFALGDSVSGAKNIIESIGQARAVTLNIISKLYGEVENQIIKRQKSLLINLHSHQYEHKIEKVKNPVIESIQDAKRYASVCLKCGDCLLCDVCDPDCRYHFFADSKGRNFYRGEENPNELNSLDSNIIIDKCTGCGTCETVCPHNVIRLIHHIDGSVVSSIDKKGCRGCGWCVASCPYFAIQQPGVKYIEALRERS